MIGGGGWLDKWQMEKEDEAPKTPLPSENGAEKVPAPQPESHPEQKPAEKKGGQQDLFDFGSDIKYPD